MASHVIQWVDNGLRLFFSQGNTNRCEGRPALLVYRFIMASSSKSTGCCVIWNTLASLFLPALPKQKPFFKAIFQLQELYKHTNNLMTLPLIHGAMGLQLVLSFPL